MRRPKLAFHRTVTNALPSQASAPVRAAAGFTFIEVIIAVVILAAAVSTLVGLQSANLGQTLRNRRRAEALLGARRIMAQYEAELSDMKPKKSAGTLASLLKEEGLMTQEGEDLSALEQYSASLEIANWGIPNMADDIMRRITVRVWWGETELDAMQLEYFTPSGDPNNTAEDG